VRMTSLRRLQWHTVSAAYVRDGGGELKRPIDLSMLLSVCIET
jgi:hypothetical protein